MVESKTSAAVSVRDVSKRFTSGDFYLDALKGLDLEAQNGEILMIVGPSGCGKTTLLSVIAGTLHFDSGEVYINDHSLKTLSEQQMTEFRRSYIGFIFQQYHLIKSLDSAQNVSIPLLLNGVDKIEASDRATEMLRHVGLKGREQAKPAHLSGGEQQRVSIARALIHKPSLLICDEPTAALDAESGARIMKLLKEIAQSKDRCIIVVTHDSRIFKYADRIVRMEDGLIVGYGLENSNQVS